MGRVEAVEALLHLPIREIHDHAAEQLDHVEVIEVGEVPAGLRKEKIASEHRNACIKTAVDCVHAPPGRGLVHHVIVHERGGVDHLGDLSQPTVAGRKLTLIRQGPRQQQNNAWAQTLSSCAEQVFRGGLKNGMTCSDQAAQVSEQGFKICLYRLE